MNKLEIAVNTKEQAIIAQTGGADRLEVTNQTLFGGTTPSFEDFSEVITHALIPCYIQIRPTIERWSVNENEFERMLHIIEIAKMAGATGIILGVIKDGKVDKEKLEKIIKVKGELELIFNHAIDSTYDYETELKYLIDNEDVNGIVTNGSATTIFDGILRLKPFLEEIKSKLIIGGSINKENIEFLRKEGFEDIVYQCTASLRDDTGRLSLNKIKEFKDKLN